MIRFTIEKPNDEIRPYLQDKIDNLTKPKGSLGVLEDLAMQIGWVQQTLSPQLNKPTHIVFAGDHGIAAEGVSPSPQEVTYQMVANFWAGGAGINFLARQHGIDLKVVDAGVNYDFKPDDPIIDMKIRKSTRNYLHEAAMTHEEMALALERGAACAEGSFKEGCNVIGFGEMGITNTSSSSLWMNALTGIPLDKCIGAGCDFTGSIIHHKFNVLSQSMKNYTGDGSVKDIMRYFGGYEMVMAVGAMLKAAELKMLILVDGFIMTNCVLVASKLYPEVLHYCIFGHQGDEAGHKLLLDYLKASPILNLGFRLGEGTGALCAYPIIESAVRMINEMHSFKKIQVTKYF
ncbi:nicotinate-nucleotide--dimethylbenzimidazole phosphoribosyltransferase [Parabacteroides sp. PFB2-10]|uniref:nicotinate-nucleotide--dimethylbenzimidazole phosphoribosyltransferase n=1 Tax=Parabacteroides sp. PFB2-10 TaxID=1742405 RepID=UPI002474D72E|nr:nicotinate-nucleotide--dimethylbenzimidazole phosphoribosyltransferase [Parabacteroides sp. PFB2-10]MDH6313720.1 nicotinate-nucleotide--dimethylbenzimidazole phosphoribosyltransferase [Parabacteroides sp. PFB2-10]